MITYNGAEYLKEMLDSILVNLAKEDEIIVSDDGSTDGTWEMLEKYQKQDTRIRLVKGPQQGVKQNVQNALKYCTGEYIFLADQDDVWTNDKVKKVMEVFETKDCSLVIHDAKVVRMTRPLQMELESFFAFRNAGAGVWKNIIKNSYIGCCMAFKAELLGVALPIPNDIEMHDQWLGVLNDKYYQKSYFLREPLLLYRRHGQNSSAMTHYKIPKMIRNRIVFCWRFLQRIRECS